MNKDLEFALDDPIVGSMVDFIASTPDSGDQLIRGQVIEVVRNPWDAKNVLTFEYKLEAALPPLVTLRYRDTAAYDMYSLHPSKGYAVAWWDVRGKAYKRFKPHPFFNSDTLKNEMQKRGARIVDYKPSLERGELPDRLTTIREGIGTGAVVLKEYKVIELAEQAPKGMSLRESTGWMQGQADTILRAAGFSKEPAHHG